MICLKNVKLTLLAPAIDRPLQAEQAQFRRSKLFLRLCESLLFSLTYQCVHGFQTGIEKAGTAIATLTWRDEAKPWV
jgi:hypothetical protein